MNHAIIAQGKVVNVVLADQAFAKEQGWVECPDSVSVGWVFDGSTFSKDPNADIETARLRENSVRDLRNNLLAGTDWVVVFYTEKGATIPLNWKEYRQALRDITVHPNFPYLLDEDWPMKPD